MRTARLALIYLAAITGAELVTALVDSFWGIILHFVILFLLILNGAIVGKHPSHRLFLALGLAPLIRILSLSMPLAEFSQIYWYLIISVPVLAGIFAVIRSLELHPADVGLTAAAMPLQGFVALTGIVFGIVEYFILRPEPLVEALRWQEILLPALILLVATGFVEELAFRGVMQRVSAKALGSWGWVFIAVLFTMLQIGHLSALHCLFVFPVALYYGWIVRRTGSILGVTLSHGLLNIGLYLIFPFAFG
ncbi:MAG: CPBP family intramembrane glutamic endopeptidase [Dehalococcoidia bacterium]